MNVLEKLLQGCAFIFVLYGIQLLAALAAIPNLIASVAVELEVLFLAYRIIQTVLAAIFLHIVAHGVAVRE
jgi:hypothetical protein